MVFMVARRSVAAAVRKPPWTGVFFTAARHRLGRSITTMPSAFAPASAYRIQVQPEDSALLPVELEFDPTAKVSELLQKDLEDHHVFFSADGFHDHIAHHLLTLYGTGASVRDLQRAFDTNVGIQARAMKPREDVVEALRQSWSNAAQYLGHGRHYPSFLRFFQREIDKRGWEAVLRDYLFGDDEASRDMQARLFAGLVHPMIQLLYGIEWRQPAIVASALAQTAVHDNKLLKFFTQADAAAASKRGDAAKPMGEILDLIEAAGRNEKLAGSAKFDDRNRIFEGVMARAYDEVIQLASEVRIEPGELDERTAEMLHGAAYVAITAAFHPPHVPKYDFFLIHNLTSAPFFLVLNQLPWVSTAVKVRLLENKIRLGFVEYLARGRPPLDIEALHNYVPLESPHLVDSTEDLLPRFHPISDDGHSIKTARALVLAQRTSRPYHYAGRSWVRINTEKAWLKALYLLLDANEHSEIKWVRAGGYDEAWEDIPKLLM